MMIIEDKLPDTLGGLLRTALRDLRKVEDDPKYTVNMIHWHTPNYDLGSCHVCLAGAVLAKSCGLDREVEINSHDVYSLGPVSRKIRALDLLRMGYIQNAYTTFYRAKHSDHISPYWMMASYGNDGFWRDMDRLVDFLVSNKL